ncbi:Cox19-like CHCH family protein [Hibiscus syriacus]|uniref:Cox19-like CHCH family protein n=1 Tax=Hibiscus syriacus TaxID=106335 RepID=A0A6A2Z5E9_HIBSY|nr:Cox19-like CHCH family protein [Hibiscus syriacus]
MCQKQPTILCRALGGKTGRAISGWDIGLTTIHLSPSASKLFSSLEIPNTLSVIECHRDEVRELPPKAEVIAWSERTGVEMFRYGDHMMGIQGHPEYVEDILIHLIDRLRQRNIIADSDADELKAKLGKVEPDKMHGKNYAPASSRADYDENSFQLWISTLFREAN